MKYEQWAGYLEHATAENLDLFTANAGKGGCTIFAEMLKEQYGIDFHGRSWCVTFVFAVHEKVRKLGKPCSGVLTLARRMIIRMRWRRRKYRPKRGDLVFTRNKPEEIIGHVGIVLDADDSNVISIEGNSVDETGAFPSELGGAVSIRKRNRSDQHIVGYAKI